MSERQRTALGLAVLLGISLLGLGRDLWTPDEPREAEIGREMLLQPSVVPTLNGEVFIEKPPLYYWTMAAAYALAGGPSPAAARSVSAAAAFLTLALVFFWGRRELSAGAGFVAALGLATSEQFLITSHWVVMDSLLMLFTTIAVIAGSEIVRGRGGTRALVAFYGALGLALLTKGLIGPVLLAAGLLAYAAVTRSFEPLRRLHVFAGSAALLALTGVLALAIYASAGGHAVYEWLWVNHVLRFVHPQNTGHEQPFYYYASALPIAIYPWWVPLASLLRPSRWRPEAGPARELRVYLGALALGMLALLSAASTKRGLYLLPLLPPLFLLLASEAAHWWALTPARLRGAGWWTQVALVVLLAAAPVAIGAGYLHSIDAPSIAALAAVGVLTALVVAASRRGRRVQAAAALGACAVAGVVALLVVLVHRAAPQKDLSPFLADIDARLKPGEPVYALGNLDETLFGIVPFVTGRPVVPITPAAIAERQPDCVFVQNGEGGRGAVSPEPPYELDRDRLFGPERYWALWCRGTGAAAATAGDAAPPAAP